MFSFKRSINLLCAVGLTILFVWQWIRSYHHLPHLLDKDTLAKTTNITVYDLQYRQFDLNGNIVHFLETPCLQHVPKNDIHRLTTPHLIVVKPNQEPWEIHAEQGVARSGGKTITLQRHVRVQQHKPHEDTLLSTEHLIYYPHEKKAKSDDEVTLTQAGNSVRSKGFTADLAENHIHLLSNARGHYVQPSN